MRRLRSQAIELECQLKAKRKAKMMEHIEIILDKCVGVGDAQNVTDIELSKYRLLNVPSLRATVRTTSFCADHRKPSAGKTNSLPATPVFDATVDELHKQFLLLKPPKNNVEVPEELMLPTPNISITDDSMVSALNDVSVSEDSIVSTDLAAYMNDSETESASETTTPMATSDSETSTSLECSTPIKSERIRRLSYTLEAPSPVLLKLLQKANHQANNAELLCATTEPIPPVLSMENSDSLLEDHTKDEHTATQQESGGNVETKLNSLPSEQVINEKMRDNLCDASNGNAADKQVDNSDTSHLNPAPESLVEKQGDNNGNTSLTNGSKMSSSLIEDFIVQQQKLMQELLEQQNKEQERLVNLFKEQEKQLMSKLKSAPKGTSSAKNRVCRSLQSSFEAKAEESVKHAHFCKLTALVRGYLTRRLLSTDRVQDIIQTIHDTTQCLRELDRGTMTILPSDIELHRRLLQQLNGAINSFHDVFFCMDVKERMQLISRDREKKYLMINGLQMDLRPRSRSLTSATLKSLERKLGKQDSRPNSSVSSSTTLPRTSPSSQASSSVSVKTRSSTSACSVSSQSSSTSQSNGN